MAHVRIEMDRGRGWEMRGESDVSAEDAAAIDLKPYAIQFPHRLIVDGQVIAEAQPKKRRKSG